MFQKDIILSEKQYSSFFADDLTPTRHFSNPERRNVETPQNMRKNPPTKSENAEAEENGEGVCSSLNFSFWTNPYRYSMLK